MKTCRANLSVISPFAGFFLFCSLFLVPDILHADSDVAARYVQSEGKNLVIEITTGSNPPPLVILIQRFPSGVTMLTSQPAASNYTMNQHKAKWLLRNMRPGKSTVSMTLDRPVSGSDISAKVIYKQQGGGKTEVSVGK